MSGPLHCANHPSAETYLRCNRCAKPICTRCAVRTPVGYRCKDCVRRQRRAFYDDFHLGDYLIAVGVALPLSFLAGWLIPILGWYSVFLGPLAGTAIARATKWALRRKRGQHTWLVVCGAIVLGGLIHLFASVAIPLIVSAGQPAGSVGRGSLGGLTDLLWATVYLVTAVGAAYAWLRPGRRG